MVLRSPLLSPFRSPLLSPAGVASLVPTVGLAANNTQVPTGLMVGVAANTAAIREHYASPEGAISDLVFTDVAWFINGSFSISTIGGGSSFDATYRKWVEYPAGVFTPVLYGGANTYVLLASGGLKTSDPVPVTIPAGAKFWEHTALVSTSAKSIPNSIATAQFSALGLDNGTYTFSGSPVRSGQNRNTANSFGSQCITGTIQKTGAKGFNIIGDSIAWGQGDISSVGAKGGSGYIARGLDNRFPWMKITMPGMTGAQLAAMQASPSWQNLILATKTTHIINEFGGGDLRDGRTKEQVLAAYQTIYGMFPGRKKYQTTITPRTDSTDGWNTVANQTAKTDGQWASDVALNTDIRAGLPNADGYIETSDIASSAHNSRVWIAPPVPALDGVHPNSYMANVLSAAVAGYNFA